MTRGLLRLRVGRSSLRAEALERDKVVWAGETSYASTVEIIDAVARLAADAAPACRRLVVVLERPPVQLRTLTGLPPVKARHLANLVAQQAGRFFRRNGHPLVTDAAWVGGRTSGVARAAAVEEPVAEAIASGALAAGLWLDTIAPAEGPETLSLLPSSERESRERRSRAGTRRLAVTTAAIWLGVAVIYLARLSSEGRRVERELADLQQPLAAVLDARRQLRDAEVALGAVALSERERGQSLTALARITRALPDSSVLTSMAWNGDGSGILVGAARHAIDVVARLDRAGALTNVRLDGPAVGEPVGGREWERFRMTFGGGPGRRRGG